jgi:hypothetical protein
MLRVQIRFPGVNLGDQSKREVGKLSDLSAVTDIRNAPIAKVLTIVGEDFALRLANSRACASGELVVCESALILKALGRAPAETSQCLNQPKACVSVFVVSCGFGVGDTDT